MKKIEIVLAESDPTQVAIIRSNINNDFQNIIQTVKNFSELLEAIVRNKPQLVTDGSLIFREGSQIAMKGGYKCGSESSVTVKSFVGED
jgi:hypothetical protein